MATRYMIVGLHDIAPKKLAIKSIHDTWAEAEFQKAVLEDQFPDKDFYIAERPLNIFEWIRQEEKEYFNQ